jgi:uncharacterized NAD-dependent epimerase/dehydratase family protein
VRINAEHRVAILLHEGILNGWGKTGIAYLRYGLGSVVAVIDYQSAGQSLTSLTGIERDIPIVANIHHALEYNPEILIIGIAPSGGKLSPNWEEEIQIAIKAGLSIANGLHTPIISKLENLLPGQWIWNMRQPPADLTIAKGKAGFLRGERILTVGTDMAVGKMSTALELNKNVINRGIKSKFLATGQGGLMIAGTGIALDSIKVDFAAGAVEQMVLEFAPDYDCIFIEGQGSLLHPGSTATLPLIRGSQPTALILVHRAGQTTIKDIPEVSIPPLTEVINLHEMIAKVAVTGKGPKVKGIALNTFGLDEEEAKSAIASVSRETNLPCTDVVRFGGDLLVNYLI